MPWSINFNYNFNYSKPQFESTITNTVSASGDVNITRKWKMGFNTGYDLKSKKLTYTTLDIYRDLHCWELKFNVIPFGDRKSYSLDIRVKSAVLQDLKLTRKRSWFDLQ